MRLLTVALSASGVVLAFASTAVAQSTVLPNPSRLISLSGVLRPADGQPLAAEESVTLSIYADDSGGTALWRETQTVTPDAAGRYTVLLGATQAEGIPLELFASGEARWIGITLLRPGESEGIRMRLTSVPYALHASNAETLGGRPASAYALAPAGGEARTTDPSTPAGGDTLAPPDVLPGTTNFIAKYVNAADVGNSALYEAAGLVGLGTAAPLDLMHVRFTNTTGARTGLAVQNLGGTASSYSGMLFYDQAGTLVQFQGFNNLTHEYRINNIARNSSSAFDGTINFMTGGTSRFLVAANGNVGIGTTSPTARLQVAGNAVVNGNVTASGEFNYVKPMTAYYAVSDSAFSSRDGTSVAKSSGSGGAFPIESTGFGLAAPINLPQGATIVNVRLIYIDNSASNMTIFITAHNIAAGFYSTVMTHTTAVETPAVQTVDVAPASPWTVDNSLQSLAIMAFPNGAWSGPEMMIRGAIVTYTMARAGR